MRSAVYALALLLSAAATTVTAETAPALNLPPFPSSPPSAPVSPAPNHDIRVLASPYPHADVPHPPRGRVCFSQAETREKILQRRLTDPVSAMRAGRGEGEALRARLCRWKQDELVYEVYVLRRDGRILRLYINAQSGQAVPATETSEHR